MSREYYKPGDPNFICDRCGFKYRQSEIRKEWSGLLVCEICWEPKHPQLSVRAIREKIAVKNARPRQTDKFDYTESSTTLSAIASKGATSISLVDATGISVGDAIAVTTDEGSQIWTTVTSVPSTIDIVTNGDMELDASWTDDGTPTTNERSSEQAYAGTYSRKIVVAGNSGIGGILQVISGQTVDKFYRVTAQIYIDSLTAGNLRLNWDAYTFDIADVAITGEWQELSGVIDYLGYSNQLIIYAWEQTGTFYVDNVSIKENVEITAALLAGASSGNSVVFTSDLNPTVAGDL